MYRLPSSLACFRPVLIEEAWMATFILVHGALHGGWCWDKIVERLRAANHRVLAPDLPGMGGNWAPPGEVTLEATGRFIANLARQQDEKVVLVAHSLGGITISDAAERAPDTVAGLVYVAAVLVPDGGAAGDLFEGGSLPEGLSLSDDGLTLTDHPDHARHRYYSGCEEADVQMALSRLTPQPAQPLVDRLALTLEGFGRLPRAYVQCRHDNALPFDLQRAQQVTLPCNPVFTMETGHSPFLQAPDLLATHLITAAAAFALRTLPEQLLAGWQRHY